MHRLHNIISTWGPESCSTKDWPTVSTASFADDKKNRFNQRKRSLELYLDSTLPVAEILKQTGMSRTGLTNLVRRAFTPGIDGRPAGYLACIPDFRLKTYTRTESSEAGRAGRFSQFLFNQPDIRDRLDQWATGKSKIRGTTIRSKRTNIIWQAFFDLCAQYGVDTTLYPFSNADGGKEAIRNYCRQKRESDFVSQSRVECGDHAGRLASRSQLSPHSSAANGLKPYERVQLDGHKIDVLLTVALVDEYGDIKYLPISRVWLLVALDCASRAVLGYSISLLENYSMENVLECIANTIEPWSPRALPATNIRYTEGAGIPSGVIDECAWRVFDSLQYDNAYSQFACRAV